MHFIHTLALSLTLALFTPAHAADSIHMTIATVAPKDSPWASILVQYKDVIEKKSNGRIKVKLMLGGVVPIKS